MDIKDNMNKEGNVVQLLVSVRKTSATASGKDVFKGTINETAIRPKATASGSSYYASHAIGGTVITAGQIVVRNTSQTAFATSASQPINMSFMYMID